MIMLTLEQKNERAFNLVDYSETPSLQFELLEVFTCEPDWRMKSHFSGHNDKVVAGFAGQLLDYYKSHK